MPENHSNQPDGQVGSEAANTAMDQHRDGPTHVAENATAPPIPDEQRPTEVGGQKGLEPTRYGDWEKRGRCTDF